MAGGKDRKRSGIASQQPTDKKGIHLRGGNCIEARERQRSDQRVANRAGERKGVTPDWGQSKIKPVRRVGNGGGRGGKRIVFITINEGRNRPKEFNRGGERKVKRSKTTRSKLVFAPRDCREHNWG